jgi:hypothetical protein
MLRFECEKVALTGAGSMVNYEEKHGRQAQEGKREGKKTDVGEGNRNLRECQTEGGSGGEGLLH